MFLISGGKNYAFNFLLYVEYTSINKNYSAKTIVYLAILTEIPLKFDCCQNKPEVRHFPVLKGIQFKT